MIPILYAKHLTQLGYRLVDSFDTNLKQKYHNNLWLKNIKVSDFDIQVGVFFGNWDFISPPQVYLFEDDLKKINQKNSHFKFPLPHFSIESSFVYKEKKAYNFCYTLHDKVEINRKNFLQIISYLEMQFSSVLLKLINLKNFMHEIKQEIVPMWMILSNKFEKKSKIESLLVAVDGMSGMHEIPLTYVSSEKIQKKMERKFIIIKLSELNLPLLSKYFDGSGNITIGKMLKFIHDINPNHLKYLINILNKITSGEKLYISLFFNNNLFSFFVKWDRKYLISLKGNINIISGILNDNIFPVYIKNYCIDEVVNRNLKNIKSRNLNGLKILQIGVGAIGGYIADSLVKVGAGGGSGFFKMCDYDDLSIDNIGRHILGRKYIGINKALAMDLHIREQLGSQFNFNIDKILDSVNSIKNFNEYDLIIDATGQIEIAEYLNEKIISLSVENRPNLLHFWIYGNGECVQALMNQPSDYERIGGCISCLHQSGIDDYNLTLDPLQNKEFKKVMGLGPCSAYTPYAISSSLSVAGLAVDILLEWVNSSNLDNNYFTRYSIGHKGQRISDIKLVAQKHCPNCSNKFILLSSLGC